MQFDHITIPLEGQAIMLEENSSLNVPDSPIIPVIEGDGIGKEITLSMRHVIDASLEKAYQRKRSIAWMEIYAGGKAARVYGKDIYLPDETIEALRKYIIGIKGPLMTPVGDGIRSINVALRHRLDQYVCLRPIRYYPGIVSPVKSPEKINVAIFRENTEDLYAGIEWQAETAEARCVIEYLQQEMGVRNIRFPMTSSIGIKPISRLGTERLMRQAIRYAMGNGYTTITIVHSGQRLPYTEGAFRKFAYELARREFNAQRVKGKKSLLIENPATGNAIDLNELEVNEFLSAILMEPEHFGIIACPNVVGDYISDYIAAQVGGIGISPGANIADDSALFEATHGTAPDIAGRDVANPSSLILSGAMMLRHLGWNDAANLIENAIQKTIKAGAVTVDLAVDQSSALSCTAFTQAIVDNM